MSSPSAKLAIRMGGTKQTVPDESVNYCKDTEPHTVGAFTGCRWYLAAEAGAAKCRYKMETGDDGGRRRCKAIRKTDWETVAAGNDGG